MSSRRPVDRRPRAPQRPQPATASGNNRNMMAGLAFLAATVIVLGGLFLLRGNGNDNDTSAVIQRSTPSITATGPAVTADVTPTAGIVLPGLTVTTIPASPVATSTTAPGEPTPTDVVDEPTATSEPVVEEEQPTEAVADEPIPTEEPRPPAEGEFGILPPAQVVSGGVGRPFRLQYQLDTSLGNVPSSADVYRMSWPSWTADQVAEVAQSIGLDGEVEGSPGNFHVGGSQGEIYFSGSTIQYIHTVGASDGSLGDNSEIVNIAATWIYSSGLIWNDLDGGRIVGRDDDSGRAVVLFRPANVSPVLSFLPSATVTVGPGGTILESNIRWPSAFTPAAYELLPAETLWNRVRAGEGAIEADLSAVESSGALSGTLSVTSISVAYSYAGSPAATEYLVPLIVFSGTATLAETGDVVPVSIYIAAVAGQPSPQG